jgi:hypothetical protein
LTVSTYLADLTVSTPFGIVALMTSPTPAPEHDLRSLFVDAARRILEESDTPLDLRKVADRAGKSRTAPYLAFGKTEEGGGLAALRLAVASQGIEELARTMEAAIRAETDPESALQGMAAAYLAFATDHPRLFRLAFGADVARDLGRPASAPAAQRERKALEAARARLEWVILSAIRRQNAGTLRDYPSTDPRVISGAIWAILHGVAMLSLDNQWGLIRGALGSRGEGEGSPETLAQEALRFLTFASTDALREAERALARAWASKPSGIRLHEVPPYQEDALTSRNTWVIRETREAPLEAQEPSELELRERPRHEVPDELRDELRADSGGPTRVSESSPIGYGDRPPLPKPTSSVFRRARTQLPLVQGARILWIDDHPELLRHEREVLERLGASVEMATSTGEAAEMLDRERFHLILSDIERDGDPRAGIRAIVPLRELGGGIPLILYVQRVLHGHPVPDGALGLTNDPEELLHLALDALGRVR